MSIVVKKIAKKECNYRTYECGKKAANKYIGPASHSASAAKKARIEEGKKIPSRFQSLLWGADSRSIKIKQHSRFIIERVLEMGDLDALRWIQRIYPTNLIIDVCESSRRLSPKSRNFWQIWFGLHQD